MTTRDKKEFIFFSHKAKEKIIIRVVIKEANPNPISPNLKLLFFLSFFFFLLRETKKSF